MNNFKLLIDTNVVIGLEDPQPVQASLAELVRLSAEHSVGLFVHGANYDDVARDKDDARREVTLSKLAKFQKLQGLPVPDDAALIARFGTIGRENDRSDVGLLIALDAKAIDFLVSQDGGLHRRADKAGLGGRVLTVEEALQWLKETFTPVSVSLPYVIERKAYQLRPEHAIFTSLREDYAEFDQWFDKCKREHRDCWTLEIGDEIAGIVIRKDEHHVEAGTQHRGPKILKMCTFKVRDEYQGEKFGELLLKQVLWFAQRNRYDLTYVTVYPKHAFLIDLLGYYGFRQTIKMGSGEIVLEKPMAKGPLPVGGASALDSDRSLSGERVRDRASSFSARSSWPLNTSWSGANTGQYHPEGLFVPRQHNAPPGGGPVVFLHVEGRWLRVLAIDYDRWYC
jgi:GNAT superfamily N-acetyltransferase